MKEIDPTKITQEEMEEFRRHENPWKEVTKDENSNSNSNPFSRQVGGSHYKDYEIEPYEFFFKNKIPHHKAAIIRRILRYDHPTGKGKFDLEKIKHEIELIEDLENFDEE